VTSARLPLGELLVAAGLITQDVLDAALRDQVADGRRLGEILVARKLVTDTQVTQILSHQLSLPWVSLAKITPEPALLALVPKALAEQHHIVPVYLRRSKKQSTLYVATDDPTQEAALRECADAAKMEVRPMVAASHDIRSAIDAWYGEATARSLPPGKPAPAGAMRVAASVAPPPTLDRKTPLVEKPAMIPKARVPQIEEVELDDDDVVPQISTPPGTHTRPVVLVVGGRGGFARKCRQAAEAIDADVERIDLAGATVRARELTPVAIVVPEDIYAFDRLGVTKLSVGVDALRVIWSDDLEPEYLEPLLDTALKRRA
jgi:Type II secretion system (T2SS), protein E, N-terminal domain